MQNERLSAWADRINAGDTAGLLRLYHPRCAVTYLRACIQGRAALAGAVAANPMLRAARIRGVNLLRQSPQTARFETRIETAEGHAILRHEWRLQEGRIHDHAIVLVAYRPHRSTAAGEGTNTQSSAFAVTCP